MIEVIVFRAKENIIKNKNTFIEGELYFGRISKTAGYFVIRSEEGHWIPFLQYSWVFNPNKLSHIFERKATIYMRNRKRLNGISSVEDYLGSDECVKWCYSYRDKFLFDRNKK